VKNIDTLPITVIVFARLFNAVSVTCETMLTNYKYKINVSPNIQN